MFSLQTRSAVKADEQDASSISHEPIVFQTLFCFLFSLLEREREKYNFTDISDLLDDP